MSFHEKAEALYAETFDELSREYDQLIEVIDSEHVTVNTTNITAALSLQAIVITLIILLLQLAIEDEDTADIISEQILAVQRLQSRRKIIIKAINSCNVTITLSSEDILLSVQLLTDVLIALMIVLDIL
ncbi:MULTISPECIES: spore coat protein [Bacillus]|uniref:spore coat protein n=1 Tax=Bacillus TaxID=1386 RepID=UPI0022435B64|nr:MULTISPECIES: spore coat protein [Bacillus]MDN5388144.1 spore coat protein [Bacillus sp. LB7]MEC1020864.1 spore coat protein [Bacillus paralicheniformis]MEC1028690.1 spore coat protein [Bacillus paralicheniformis]MEC1036297.1 spore coat protein [Bacillus paralicheniformis]MEC1050706.1 spore coat protein [Bacillus paralicheniformis]